MPSAFALDSFSEFSSQSLTKAADGAAGGKFTEFVRVAVPVTREALVRCYLIPVSDADAARPTIPGIKAELFRIEGTGNKRAKGNSGERQQLMQANSSVPIHNINNLGETIVCYVKDFYVKPDSQLVWGINWDSDQTGTPTYFRCLAYIRGVTWAKGDLSFDQQLRLGSFMTEA